MALPAMRQRLIEHTLDESHTHSRELHPATMKQVKHHLDAGGAGLQPVRGWHLQIDAVFTVWYGI
ncbi:hypothetical protein SDC9_211572 [bioreactor metagenome]|uniref:Uncharacterized protein n=1 Tax=bioreactor metagenome TaxID=1076179 RepID=A0A645JK59_9ZZZZ